MIEKLSFVKMIPFSDSTFVAKLPAYLMAEKEKSNLWASMTNESSRTELCSPERRLTSVMSKSTILFKFSNVSVSKWRKPC
jgi:hypothetical protein